MARPRDWQLPFGAVVLIAVGVLLLLQNLGVLPWSLWPALIQFWPVLLIALGVRLVLGRGLLASAIIAALLVLALAGATAIALGRGPFEGRTRETIEEPKDESDRLEAKLRVGAGSLQVSALPAGSSDLVVGEFDGGARTTLRRRGGTALLEVNSGPSWLPWRAGVGGDGTVQLNREIPIELDVDAGAADMLLDLTDLQVTLLDLDTGASKVEVRLPAQVASGQLELNAGAADITIVVPQGVAARIRVSNPLSSLEIDETRFPRAGKVYESPDYATAGRRFDIDIDVAAASLKVL